MMHSKEPLPEKPLPKTMAAVVAHGPKDYRLEELPVPRPGPGEVVIKVKSAGICASDIKCYTGAALFWGENGSGGYCQAPITPGHEFAGEVVALGEGAAEKHRLAIGDMAVSEQIVPCGGCRYCKRGSYWMCEVNNIYGFRKELTIHGAHLGPHCYPVAIRMIEQGLLPMDEIVTHRLDLDEFRFDGIFGDKPSQVPPGANVTRATLRLWVGSNEKAASSHRVWLNRMLVPWDENAEWKNPRWGRDGVKADGKAAVAETNSLFVPHRNNTPYDIDVTDSLRAWAGGAPNHGWVLRNVRGHHNPAAFVSSRVPDTRRRPMLEVTFDTHPANKAPEAKALSATPDGPNSFTLSLTATDDGNEPLSVTFYGRKRAKAGDDFQVILLPDTQYYASGKFGGKPEMFYSQTEWIVKNHKERNIAFVLHLGDISNTGDGHESEWKVINKAMRLLDDPKATGLPGGIPYLITVGNHDQDYLVDGKRRANGPAALFNKYYGAERHKGKPCHGGHFGGNNNNHYALLNAGAEKFIVISLEFEFESRSPGVLKWAANLLKTHPDRRGIVLTHAAIYPGLEGAFQDDGGKVHETLKDYPNLALIIGGHTTGEGRRTDKHNGSTVHSILQDFQFDANGGDGWLGILTFSPRNNNLLVQTYSPWLDQWRTDEHATYTLDYDFGVKIEPHAKLGGANITPGDSATCQWKDIEPDADYEWFAEISDGQKTTRTKETMIHLRRDFGESAP